MPNTLLDTTGLKRLVLSRYYLGLAVVHGKSDREVDVFATINLLHEAVETFLVAGAAHVNASIGAREEFAGYLDKINQKISPSQLPFRSKLIRLNKARVMAKHDSVVPDRSEIPGFIVAVREFLEEAAMLVFNTAFRTVSLLDALPQGITRDFLQEAQNAFENGEFAQTLVACRKAIYHQYEQSYDARPFSKGEQGPLVALGSRVPFYARNLQFLEKHVSEPTDYIVLDRSRVDSDLLKDGLDSHQFWNIWRLTPRIYLADNNRWIVRYEPNKVDGPTVEESASYVLENTVDHFILLARARARQRMVGSNHWTVTAGPSGARLFLKASKSSEVTETVPPGVLLTVDGATEGLESETVFWIVMSTSGEPSKWYYGYALEADLQFG